MKRFVVRVVPAVALILAVSPLLAQQRGPGFGSGGLGSLLTNKSVQEELKVTEDQKDKLSSAVKDTFAKYKEDLSAAFKDKDREKAEKLSKAMSADVAKAAEGTLKPEQMKRLHQIEIWAGLQRGNLGVLTHERVDKILKLTDKQKEAIKESGEALGKERRELFENAGKDKDKREEITKKMEEKTKTAVDKFMSTLTSDQRKALKELSGEKFEIKFEPRRRPQ